MYDRAAKLQEHQAAAPAEVDLASLDLELAKIGLANAEIDLLKLKAPASDKPDDE
jgi:hypothetical protein